MGSLDEWRAVWAWIVAHRFEMLSVLYLASVFCAALLAGCVHSVGQKLERLARGHGAKILAVEEKMRVADERLSALASGAERLAALEARVLAVDERLKALGCLVEQMATRSSVALTAQAATVAIAADTIRSEIAQLVAELREDELQIHAESREVLPALNTE